MKPPPFEYHRVHDVREATERLRELGDEAKVLAGGQSLVPTMNFRLSRPTALVDVNRLDELAYIKRTGDGLRIGALTRHRAVETISDPDVLKDYGILKRTAGWIGHLPIRFRGTFGGSIAHGDPSSEWCLIATALDAQIVVSSAARGERLIAAGDFFEGFLTTTLESDELVTEVRFDGSRRRSALSEFAQRRGDFALVSAAVWLSEKGDDVRVALGGVASIPWRAAEAEEIIKQGGLSKDAIRAAGEAAAASIDPAEDIHASAEYRKKLAAVLVSRALEEVAVHDN